ncbi:mechanosensitive ion channel family protein [Ichthyobacterium seriolicida]|uniref:Mechanosensitive ion channel MscS n=1 Tax=Ichthyobacterium seriolicida TaxID=242600 RepID=A0A1J1DYV3_9FLAO|nr:mechanosensitive ion channel family protein [Ichthyobacterium seriolicida]BAV95095.1 mechanosensitive ion channel MscS [Ichthyobacterium seriolicida]
MSRIVLSSVVIVCLSILSLYAQHSVKADLTNPSSTIYTHLHFLESNSYDIKESIKTIIPNSVDNPEEVVIKLKKIFNGKGLFVDFYKIPTDPNYQDTIRHNRLSKYVLFPNEMPLIYLEKKGNNWYYSEETVEKVDHIYDNVFPSYTSKVKKLIPKIGYKKIFNIELWKFLGIFVLSLSSMVLGFFLKKLIFFILNKIYYRIIKNDEGFGQRPLRKISHVISLMITINFFVKIFPSLEFESEINKWLFLALNIVSTVFWIYLFLKLAKIVMNMYVGVTEGSKEKLTEQIVPILDNFLKGIIIFAGFLKIITLFGIDATTVLAGASIGGLAVALASQDTVKNLIGTFMIFLDKPFQIGDWIEAENIVGSVEQVSFRSSMIRAADTSIYQIPNSRLAEIVINNKGLRLYRRYKTELGIRYDTPPELIQSFVYGIREIIIAHPETRSESYNVEFTGFGDSALLIMLNTYFKSLEWGVEQSSKHRLHMAIVKLAKNLGVEFAFPSSTLMIEQMPNQKDVEIKYNTDKNHIEEMLKKTIDDFKKK